MTHSRKLLSLLLILSASGLQGCTSVPSDVGCSIFPPIRDSASDTAETRQQVSDHNVQWNRKCLKQ